MRLFRCLIVGLAASLAGSLACSPASPAGGPEATCARACVSNVAGCSESQCARGCNLILDRLAEREGGHVLSCIAANPRACDDRAWSACATRIGPHADGGPPAPAPAPTFGEIPGGD